MQQSRGNGDLILLERAHQLGERSVAEPGAERGCVVFVLRRLHGGEYISRGSSFDQRRQRGRGRLRLARRHNWRNRALAPFRLRNRPGDRLLRRLLNALSDDRRLAGLLPRLYIGHRLALGNAGQLQHHQT